MERFAVDLDRFRLGLALAGLMLAGPACRGGGGESGADAALEQPPAADDSAVDDGESGAVDGSVADGGGADTAGAETGGDGAATERPDAPACEAPPSGLWTRRTQCLATATEWIPPIEGGAIAYDEARSKLIAFGGDGGWGGVSEQSYLWEWDGIAETWARFAPCSSCVAWPKLNGGAMSYDSSRSRPVLVTTSVSSPKHAEIWEWDGDSASWANRTPSASLPPAWLRPSGGLVTAFDSKRKRLVVMARVDDPVVVRALWEWDGEAGTWEDRTPASFPMKWPRLWDRPSMVYDSFRMRIIVVGRAYPTDREEVWEWDGNTGAWTNRPPVSPTALWPAPFPDQGLAFDAARNVVVLTGSPNPKTDGREVMEWDGTTGVWVGRRPEDAPAPPPWPGPRTKYRLAYDTARERVVLVGGHRDYYPQVSNQVWDWDGSAAKWLNRTPAIPMRSSTLARTECALAYDGATGHVVLFGGRGSDGFLDDMWQWDAVSGAWVALKPDKSPPARAGHSMAYDSSRARVVMFGGVGAAGDLRDTWEWDGVAATWTERKPAGPLPDARTHPGLAFDETRGRIILFGGHAGTEKNDIWEWDGVAGAWTERTVAGSSPTARLAPGLVYDRVKKRIVMFGGNSNMFLINYDTSVWEWDGGIGSWTEHPRGAMDVGPMGRQAMGFIYDSKRARSVLFGGQSGDLDDAWEWDSAANLWIERVEGIPGALWPEANSYFGFAFDETTGKGVMQGGQGPTFYREDTWEWNGVTP